MKREDDREKVSDATIEQRKEEEQEEDIDQIKKEEEDDNDEEEEFDQEEDDDQEEEEEEGEDDDDDYDFDPDTLLNVPDGFNEFLDTMLDEVLKEPETSTTDIEESEATRRKRIKISETEETKAPQLRIESVPAMDPLEIIMEIVSKYHDFIDFILEMLKEEGQSEEEMEMQRWSKVLERGKHLVESLKQKLERLPDEMERMRNDENLQKEYFFREDHIEDVIAQMRDLNERISSSPHIKVVSDLNFRLEVLPLCLDELERSKEELSELIEVIIELKEINTEENEENYMIKKYKRD